MNRRKSVAVEFSEVRTESGESGLLVGTIKGEPLQVFDRTKGETVRTSHGFRCDIFPECGGEWYCLMTEWYVRHGYRYAFYKTLPEAVEAGKNWASRRFAYLHGGEN